MAFEFKVGDIAHVLNNGRIGSGHELYTAVVIKVNATRITVERPSHDGERKITEQFMLVSGRRVGDGNYYCASLITKEQFDARWPQYMAGVTRRRKYDARRKIIEQLGEANRKNDERGIAELIKQLQEIV